MTDHFDDFMKTNYSNTELNKAYDVAEKLMEDLVEFFIMYQQS